VHPTTASRAAEETLDAEHLAHERGEDWVTDGRTPQAFMADGNLRVPSHYAEAMRRPDLWEGPVREELEKLCSRGVFCIMKRSFLPAGKKVIGCRWVFANKYDADGTVIK